jgi:hypothetical protein
MVTVSVSSTSNLSTGQLVWLDSDPSGGSTNPYLTLMVVTQITTPTILLKNMGLGCWSAAPNPVTPAIGSDVVPGAALYAANVPCIRLYPINEIGDMSSRHESFCIQAGATHACSGLELNDCYATHCDTVVINGSVLPATTANDVVTSVRSGFMTARGVLTGTLINTAFCSFTNCDAYTCSGDGWRLQATGIASYYAPAHNWGLRKQTIRFIVPAGYVSANMSGATPTPMDCAIALMWPLDTHAFSSLPATWELPEAGYVLAVRAQFTSAPTNGTWSVAVQTGTTVLRHSGTVPTTQFAVGYLNASTQQFVMHTDKLAAGTAIKCVVTSSSTFAAPPNTALIIEVEIGFGVLGVTAGN